MSKGLKVAAIVIVCLLLAGWIFDPIRLPILGYPDEKAAGLPQFHYAYDQLTSPQQSIYRRLLTDLRDYKEALTVFPHLTHADDVEAAFTALLSDNPELFWVKTSWEYSELSILGGLMGIQKCRYMYDCEPALSRQRQAEIESATADFLKTADSRGSDYEKAVAAHNYIIKTTRYAEGYSVDSTAYSEVSTIYSALVGGEALCSGYAKAYQYLLGKMGVECSYISGKANGEDHAWNLVKLDGEYYYVDVTWDDPVYSNGAQGMRFDYFCIPSSALEKTHTADSFPSVPVCSDDSHWSGR